MLGAKEEPLSAVQPTLGYPRSWIWSAAPGVSLQSADASAARAWVESSDLFQNIRVSYPGFAEATTQSIMDGLVGADNPTKIGGTDRVLIRSLTVSNDEMRVRFCVVSWDTFYFNGSTGDFVGAGFDLSTSELLMRRGAAVGSVIRGKTSPGRTVQPAAPAGNPGHLVPSTSWLKGPTTNVFADWVATWRDSDIKTPADCVAWFKRSHPGLNYPTGYTAEKRPNRPAAPPPPTLPASPGW
ncbi:hypothetical protein PWY87_24255 [Kribbella solani]|uniref:hypothetical protein n=1 Tax=Kribbella solani TaxID=236067 RepID=UPI0029A2D460|nr:hypothetical protein [Kribbella solani]MDX3004818.1 hypothetical protein [Kribbella solani]